MSDQKRHEKLIETKLALAAKYESMVRVANSAPKRQKFRHRAEAYRQQARVLSGK